MRKNIIDKFEFDWDGLQTELEDLSLSNFRGKNNQGFVKVTLPDFVGSYGLKENKIYSAKSRCGKDIRVILFTLNRAHTGIKNFILQVS